MSLYQLKSHFQDQLRPISNALVEQNVTANQVTVSAVLLSMGTAYVVTKPAVEKQKLWLLLPSSLFIRMALNAIDGMMAREHNQASTLGAILNEVGDIVADTALLASLLPHVADQKSDASVISLSAHQHTNNQSKELAEKVNVELLSDNNMSDNIPVHKTLLVHLYIW